MVIKWDGISIVDRDSSIFQVRQNSKKKKKKEKKEVENELKRKGWRVV